MIHMRPACFIHVFKAGGTSVSDWLCQHYPESIVAADPITFRENRDRHLSAPLVRGHIFARDVPKGRVMLTVVRKPEAQFMSALWHFASGATNDRRHLPFDGRDLSEQARLFTAEIDAGQSRFFDPNGLAGIDVVGLTERLQDSLRLFAWRLGLPPPREVAHARHSKAGNAPMPDKIRDILREQLERDCALYDAARDQFQRDFAELTALSGGRVDAFLADHSRKPT